MFGKLDVCKVEKVFWNICLVVSELVVHVWETCCLCLGNLLFVFGKLVVCKVEKVFWNICLVVSELVV